MKSTKKGFTLVETILSVALILILIVPLYGILMDTTKGNKLADRRQAAASIGQSVLEELKTYDSITLSALSTGEEGFKLLDNNEIEWDTTSPSIVATGTFRKRDTSNTPFDISINVERENEFIYLVANPTINTEDNQYDHILTLSTNATNQNIITHNSSPENGYRYDGDYAKYFLLTINDSLGINIKDFNNTDNTIGAERISNRVAQDNTNLREKIKVVLEESFSGNITIYVDDYYTTNNVEFHVVKNENCTGTLSIKGKPLGLTSGSGIFQVLSNVSSATTNSNIGNLYKITVTVKNKGEVLFRSTVTNNIKLNN